MIQVQPSPAKPQVSVLMAVYNTDRFLRQALDSILQQTFTDFELVIIDDGSTDRSGKILERYAARDARIRLTRRENRGVARTRNELIALARGELVAVMDGDDVALPDRLQAQVEFLEAHPQVVCVGGAQTWIDAAGRILVQPPILEQDCDIQKMALAGITPINHPCALIRRSALLQVGGYDETMATVGDLDLFLRLGEVGQLANLPQTVLHYRIHPRSISESKQLPQTDDRREACQRAWKRRGISGEFAELPPWRPIDRPSRHEFLLKYGWGFFNRGERQAAIVYGLKAIRTLPLQIAGWKLFACALIKPMPEVQQS